MYTRAVLPVEIVVYYSVFLSERSDIVNMKVEGPNDHKANDRKTCDSRAIYF